MRAGEVAQAAGINRETLRYCERRGLLGEPSRSPGGHRLYGEQTLVTLRVKAAQRLGFTLNEITDLIETGRGAHRKAGLKARAATNWLMSTPDRRPKRHQERPAGSDRCRMRRPP